MEYTVQGLARMAGVTPRTLRYYDEIGLLVPVRARSNGYRVYGRAEVDKLQQILFYRALEVPLEEIARILAAKDFSNEAALEGHLQNLLAKRGQLDALIENVRKTLSAAKGEIEMRDPEKFEGFVETLIAENEEKYGAEIREKYGDAAAERSNAKLRKATKEDYAQAEALGTRMQEALKEAFAQGDPAGELAQRACDLHRQWLCFFWDDYTKAAHKGVTQMYVDDPRFAAYYDAIAPGCAKFFRDAVNIYCE